MKTSIKTLFSGKHKTQVTSQAHLFTHSRSIAKSFCLLKVGCDNGLKKYLKLKDGRQYLCIIMYLLIPVRNF